MELHTLRFRGIGPFPGEHEIDFEALGASRLFLLEGPTGSGKSTIIDAITFALYGQTAAVGTDEARLRSDFADPALESFVELRFSTAAGSYLIRRTPKWERPKKRGTGTTTQNQQVTLTRLASSTDPGPGDAIATRVDEAGREILRIIGLTKAQFVQTVVLPQGEFATFLQSPPEMRRGVLQRVFGTELYEDTQDELADMRRQANSRVQEADREIGQAISRFTGVVGISADSPERAALAAAGKQPEELVKLLAEKADQLAAAATEAADALTSATEADTAAGAALSQGKQTADDQAQLVKLRQKAEQLTAAEPAHSKRVAELASAIRADRVAVVADALVAAEEKAAAADEAVTKARELPAVAQLVGDDAEVAANGAARDRANELAERAARLDAAVQLEAELSERRAAIVAAQDALELQRQELARDHDGLANRPQARTELAARRATVRTAAADVGAATAAVTEAETRVDAVQGVIDLMLSLDAATMRRAIAVNQAELASAAEQEARAAWRAGLAGELAAGLTPDEPCPVCGSRKHPAPAIASDDHVTAEQVEAVEAGRRDAERQLQDAHAAWQSLTEQLKTRQEAAGGLGGLEAQDLLTKAQRRLQVAQEAAEELPGIEAEYEQFDQATLALREELAEREIAVATAATQLTARADTLRDDEATVADAGCGYPSVVARQERLQRAAKQLQDLSDAEGVAKQARGVVKATSADLIQAAADAGFDTPVAAAAARRTPAQREGLETEIQAHTEAQAVVRQGLAEPRIQAAATAEVPDLPALRQAAESAAAVLVEANRNHETAVRLATGAADAVEEVQRAIHLSAEVRAECEPIIRVADLANASTTDAAHRTTLASYVLLRRFDEMVAAANVRLDVMSGSRFALERSEEREGGERKRGLGLIVRDHTTGSPRSPGNISGGETFVVSLALALGLADVVQAEAGGVDLGTLFVDEGFGSLDPDYLDLVMTQLDELRAGGRIVGVVSHVEAMKARVPERVEVRRCADGSSTLTVRA